MTGQSITWTTFECDGQTFEYAAIAMKQKTRPAGWPAHEASPGPWLPGVIVVVRKLGDETGPGKAYPKGTVVTSDHAVEAARLFWLDLTR